MRSIEDIILTKDYRGISILRPSLPHNFCEQAAQFTLGHIDTVFIATGFYTVGVGAPETDGPPGVLALGNALSQLGCSVYYVTDQFTASLMHALADRSEKVISFPLADHAASERCALDLLQQFQPSLLLAIERCGFTQDKEVSEHARRGYLRV